MNRYWYSTLIAAALVVALTSSPASAGWGSLGIYGSYGSYGGGYSNYGSAGYSAGYGSAGLTSYSYGSGGSYGGGSYGSGGIIGAIKSWKRAHHQRAYSRRVARRRHYGSTGYSSYYGGGSTGYSSYYGGGSTGYSGHYGGGSTGYSGHYGGGSTGYSSHYGGGSTGYSSYHGGAQYSSYNNACGSTGGGAYSSSYSYSPVVSGSVGSSYGYSSDYSHQASPVEHAPSYDYSNSGSIVTPETPTIVPDDSSINSPNPIQTAEEAADGASWNRSGNRNYHTVRHQGSSTVLAKASVASDTVLLTVAVPESAQVLVNGHATSSTGPIRQFMSRGLKAGYTYTYNVVVSTEQDDKVVTKNQSVTVRAGSAERLVFDMPAASPSKVETVLTLHVPEHAKVILAENPTQGAGTTRTFQTKVLPAGKTWENYKIEVSIVRDGQPVVKEKVINLAAGSQNEFTFDFESEKSTTLVSR